MSEALRTVGDKLRGPGMDDETREAHEAAIERAKTKPLDQEVVQVFEGEVRARWKIEVTFVKNRSLVKLNHCGIQVWESGKHFHGGGDSLAFFCKDNRKGHDEGCWGVIPQDNVAPNGVAYCPSCKAAINANHLTNMKLGVVYLDGLAKELAALFRKLGSNADIVIKYHRTDVRYAALEKAKGPDVARKLKGMHIYPLKNIIKDTSAGATLEGRMKAFITS